MNDTKLSRREHREISNEMRSILDRVPLMESEIKRLNPYDEAYLRSTHSTLYGRCQTAWRRYEYLAEQIDSRSKWLNVVFDAAGLITLFTSQWCLHLLVRPRYWVWGFGNTFWLKTFGCGPLFKVVWDDAP